MLTGGCHCRSVRYEAEGEPSERALCHCTLCRGTTGAPAIAWFTVSRSAFRYTEGHPQCYESSPGAERELCSVCGTQLTFRRMDYGDRIDVTVGSLDEPDAPAVAPCEHIWTRSRLSWMTSLQGLPEQARDDATTDDEHASGGRNGGA